MYKLLIADDEPWLRKRLMLTVDWQSLGISELFEAQDGAEALDLAAQNEPDIIITDIEMPELTGIDLMRTLNESTLYPQIILISGYNEFEYAQSAVKFGATDYLLKPVNEEELKKTVIKCIERIEQNQYNKELTKLLASSSDLLRERIYIDLMRGTLDFNKVPIVRLKELTVSFPKRSALCIVCHSHPLNHSLADNDVEKTVFGLSLIRTISRELNARFKNVLDFWIDDTSVFLVFSDAAPESLLNEAEEALLTSKKNISQKHNVRIAYGLGTVVHSPSDLSVSYRKARYNINLGQLTQESDNDFKEASKISRFQSVYEEFNLKTLIATLKKGDADSASKQLTDLIAEFLNQTSGTPSSLQIKLLYINVLNSLFKGCLPYLPVSEDIIKICIDYIDESTSFHTTEKMHSQLQDLLYVLIEQYRNFIGVKRHWLIDKIIEYINEHYAESLSMSNVAAEFYLNASYFCKLFKEETGATYTHYIMRIRVENAKRLMADNSMKLYEIASAVGYTNVQYFSTVFKAIEGISPSQYRSCR